MKLKHLALSLALMGGTFAPQASQAEQINTAQLISRTSGAFFACADFQLEGLCWWWRLRCGFFGCRLRITTTPVISHYVPDVTFQTYKNERQKPWAETQLILQAAQADYNGGLISTLITAAETLLGADTGVSQLGGGGGTEAKTSKDNNLTFTIVDAFGNPTNEVLSSIGSFLGLTCSSRLTSMYPYYISNLDMAEWRFGLPTETFKLASWNPFGDYLGSGVSVSGLTSGTPTLSGSNYGGVFPRIGHNTSHDELKDSALTTFRAAHFMSRSSSTHVYTSIMTSEARAYWPPTQPVDTTSGGLWQQISPHTDDSCRLFPFPEHDNTDNSYRPDDGNYVWNLWRRYECCRRPSGWNWLGRT